MLDVLDLIDAVEEVRCQLVFLSVSVEPLLRDCRVGRGVGEGLGFILAQLADDLETKVIRKHKPKDYLKKSGGHEPNPAI